MPSFVAPQLCTSVERVYLHRDVADAVQSSILDAPLIDAALRQLAALSKDLPAEIAPDADALEFALLALRAAAEN